MVYLSLIYLRQILDVIIYVLSFRRVNTVAYEVKNLVSSFFPLRSFLLVDANNIH